MKVFQAVQSNFISLGFNPKLEAFNRIFVRNISIAAFGTTLLWIFLVYEADNSQEYIESTYFIAACVGIGFAAMHTIFHTNKLFSFFDRFEKLVNQRLQKAKSKAKYEETNQFVEKFSGIGFFIAKHFLMQCFIIPKAVFSSFIYFTTDSGNEAFVLPCPIWFPFNWKSPIGYLVAVTALLLFGMHPLQYIGCFIFLPFGVFVFEIAIVKDLKQKLRSINRMARRKKAQSRMYKQLSEFIQFHADTKQSFKSFSEVCDITLTVNFVDCIIGICAAMLLFQIQISHDEIDSIIILEAAVFGIWYLMLLLFVCELGQRFTNAMGEIEDVIGKLNWYLYPRGIQRFLPTVLLSAQEPVVVKCFGNVLCARKQFRKVAKLVYSHFMLLREFYE